MRRRDIVHLRDGRGDCYLGPPDAFDRRFRLVRRREVGRLGARLQVFANRPDAMAALRRALARQCDGGTQIWRMSDRDVIAALRHKLSSSRLAIICGKPAAPATNRRGGTLSASLSEFAHLATARPATKSAPAPVAGKMPGALRQSATGSAPETPAGPVSAWSLEERIERVLRLTMDKLPANMRAEFAELISPVSIGITVGIIVIWAASHGTPVGPAVDIILLLAGIVALGWGIFEAASALYDFIVAIIGANSEQDLDRAAQHLARAIALLGVAAFAALLRKIGRTSRPRSGGSGSGSGQAGASPPDRAQSQPRQPEPQAPAPTPAPAPARPIPPVQTGKFDFSTVGRTVSTQRQNRHVAGRPEWQARGQGGYFNTVDDAQSVLTAAHSGRAEVLGTTSQGFPVVRYDGVTGYNNNPGAGFIDQPTNVFIIKGTASPSVVPTNPNWSQR